MATRTLYPTRITPNSGFSGILSSNGTGSASYDIPTSGVDICAVVFNTDSLHNLSAACVLQSYSVAYDQRCNINQWSKLYWRLTPKRVTTYSLNGNEIYIYASSTFGRNVNSDTTGDGWLSKGGTFVDSSNIGNYVSNDIFGPGATQLGFALRGDNDHSAGSYKLHMRNLKATVTYEQRYYATFYDDDGTWLKTQNVAGGSRATPPSVSRTGYTVAWTCDGKSGTYSANNLPTSEDTDLVFRAVYTPIPVQFTYKRPSKGQINVYRLESNTWQLKLGGWNGDYRYYGFYYGDRIKAEAVDCNDLSEDLLAEVTGDNATPISSTTVSGASGTTIKVFEVNSLTANRNLSVTPQTHYFTITTSAGTGGTITSTRRVARTGSTTISVTPSAGYRITSVKVDNVSQTIANDQSFSYSFTNVQADHTVEATFARIQYTITFDLPSGVSVTANGNAVSGNAQTVNHGDTVEFAFNCGDNMSLTGLFLDSSTDSLMAPVFRQVQNVTYTMFYIAGAHTLKATATSDLVTVTIGENTGNGTVTSDDLTNGTGKFVRSGGTLHFEAEADYAWRFLQWFDEDDTGTTKNVTITAQYPENSTLTVYAEFEHPDNAVDVDIIGNGTVEKSRDAAYDDESVTFRAVAAEGWTFKKWDWTTGSQESQGSGPSQSPPRTPRKTDNPVTLLWGNVTDHVIHCYFQRTAHDVTLTKNGEPNTVAISEVENPEPFYTNEDLSDPSDGGGDYWFGATLHLTATPGTGWHFVRWSDGGGEGRNTRSIVIGTADIELQAVFAKDTFEQHFKAGEGGSVTIDGEPATDVTVEYGDDLLLTFTAELGQKIKDVLVDGVSVFEDVTLTRRGGTYLLASIDAAHTVAVVFAPRLYTNGRRLLDYYPPVIASIVDIQRLMAAYQVSIDALWDAVSFLHENQYIETATDEGVSLWERELGIIPAATDTLNQRKARLRLKWVPSNNFTTKWLHGWLEDVCGATVPWPEVEGYTLKVTLPWFASWWSIFNDLRVYKPANIVLDPIVALPDESGNLYAGFAMQTEYDYEVDGETAEPLEEEGDDSP